MNVEIITKEIPVQTVKLVNEKVFEFTEREAMLIRDIFGGYTGGPQELAKFVMGGLNLSKCENIKQAQDLISDLFNELSRNSR